jgi:hypothetical protein
MISCHKEMSCHGFVTFVTPTILHLFASVKYQVSIWRAKNRELRLHAR